MRERVLLHQPPAQEVLADPAVRWELGEPAGPVRRADQSVVGHPVPRDRRSPAPSGPSPRSPGSPAEVMGSGEEGHRDPAVGLAVGEGRADLLTDVGGQPVVPGVARRPRSHRAGVGSSASRPQPGRWSWPRPTGRHRETRALSPRPDPGRPRLAAGQGRGQAGARFAGVEVRARELAGSEGRGSRRCLRRRSKATPVVLGADDAGLLLEVEGARGRPWADAEEPLRGVDAS